MSAEYPTTDAINMSITELGAALQTCLAVYDEKVLEADGDSACKEYIAITRRVRDRIAKLRREARKALEAQRGSEEKETDDGKELNGVEEPGAKRPKATRFVTLGVFGEILGKEQEIADSGAPRVLGVFQKPKAPAAKDPAKSTVQLVMHERPDNVSTEFVAERPQQFPGQSLEAQGKILWCACCGSEVSSAKSAIGKHIKGKGHKAKLADYNLRELKKGVIASALLASRRAR